MEVSMKSKKVQDLINEIVKLTAGQTLPHWKAMDMYDSRYSLEEQEWREKVWEDILDEETNNSKGEIK